MKRIFLFLFLGGLALRLMAQSEKSPLYMPLEFKKAYEKGTRSPDGRVAAKYWQNRSVYRITASIDPHTRLLRGQAHITYYNNSPDSIKVPGFHTYHDYYKPGAKRAGFSSSTDFAEENHKGVIIETLVAGKDTLNLKNRKQVTQMGTHYVMRLAKPIPPKGSMDFTIHWNYVIPGEGFERSGAIDSTSMFIGYWYPEMAVLDDIDGWDRIVYDAGTEFYHDFSDYEIALTVPDNFMVWASVAPLNAEEVYSATLQQRLAQARQSKTPVPIFTENDFRKKATGTRTWKWEAKNFPDFAFALSDHFLWDASMYTDEHGEYFLNTAYPVNHPEFASVMPTIHSSIKAFHNVFPVYPFPFKHFTIFNGLQGGGMEFPGMANNQETSGKEYSEYMGKTITDEEAAFGLSLHEMAHMYFPFLMGIHEKKYAWMDEGFANFTGSLVDTLMPKMNRDMPYLGSQRVVPPMVPSYLHEGSALNAYTIGAVAYHSLYALLGRDQFLQGMHAFMDEWQYKHPTPYDMMFTFNRATGKDLNWFWKRWYFDMGYVDLGIIEVKGRNIEIENKGGRPLDFIIRTHFKDGKTHDQHISPEVWKQTSRYTHKLKMNSSTLSKVELILPTGGDASAKDNVWVNPVALYRSVK